MRDNEPLKIITHSINIIAISVALQILFAQCNRFGYEIHHGHYLRQGDAV